ncbi:hypothetical protein FRC08_016182, partial [Ceratobasidium sp. 394]
HNLKRRTTFRLRTQPPGRKDACPGLEFLVSTHPSGLNSLPGLEGLGIDRTFSSSADVTLRNAYQGNINDAKIRAAADQLVSLGLKDAGYTYVNIDVSRRYCVTMRGRGLTESRIAGLTSAAEML